MTAIHPAAQFLTFTIAGQLFGIPVLQVNDVLGPQRITRTPLAPPAIAGVLNLRGRIVTAVDVRRCLNQPDRGAGSDGMSVVIEQDGELFSLIIDAVGDVLALGGDGQEDVPALLSPAWRSVSSGIHRLDSELLVILDIVKLLDAAARSRDIAGVH